MQTNLMNLITKILLEQHLLSSNVVLSNLKKDEATNVSVNEFLLKLKEETNIITFSSQNNSDFLNFSLIDYLLMNNKNNDMNSKDKPLIYTIDKEKYSFEPIIFDLEIGDRQI